MTINNEEEFYKLIRILVDEKRITKEECSALENYVCGILDAISGFDIDEEDLM